MLMRCGKLKLLVRKPMRMLTPLRRLMLLLLLMPIHKKCTCTCRPQLMYAKMRLGAYGTCMLIGRILTIAIIGSTRTMQDGTMLTVSSPISFDVP